MTHVPISETELAAEQIGWWADSDRTSYDEVLVPFYQRFERARASRGCSRFDVDYATASFFENGARRICRSYRRALGLETVPARVRWLYAKNVVAYILRELEAGNSYLDDAPSAPAAVSVSRGGSDG